MTFKGFVDDKGTFFKQLAKHQDREWFKENKSRYESEWAEPMLELLGEVREGIDDAYSYCDLDEPKLFRIYRDVRFGKDKSPFKTHIGGTISITGAGGVMDKPSRSICNLAVKRSRAVATTSCHPTSSRRCARRSLKTHVAKNSRRSSRRSKNAAVR